MTLTFDRNAYGSLLLQYQPKVIQSEEENEAAIALATELEHRANLTTEESTLLDLLVTLIDRKSTRLNSSHRNTSRMPSSA